ncbi:nuclear transport factor 2 family protein [Enterovirga rhinocerotis]|uniref:Ketosteroid isomerase-like protein n=1 Tax=Enterovirga rhinocerotis TaxID=1339210 RepID=A0A4R7BTI4_9HYPH|nr:nuclear transport factor 2 family protein [Enterovirga rhinocerotis]TDR89054.1 ketosteroid isomerase-like protein [Enterovirga rhinocerotis]
MVTKSEVEALLRAAYAARQRGDLDEVMGFFGEGAHFSVSGSAAASPVPTVASGSAAICEVLRRLVSAFEFKEATIVSLVVDGAEAAVHWHVHVRSLATGEEAETDILDMLRIEDGRIVSLRQFADTALINRLLGR